jgi:hypothetical protein
MHLAPMVLFQLSFKWGFATEAARQRILFLGTRTLASGYHFKS